jgi:hypothetical protein
VGDGTAAAPRQKDTIRYPMSSPPDLFC